MQKELKELFEESVRGLKPPYSYSEVEEILLQAESLIRKEVLEELKEDIEKAGFELTPIQESLDAGMSKEEAERAYLIGTGYNMSNEDIKSLIQNKLTSQ